MITAFPQKRTRLPAYALWDARVTCDDCGTRAPERQGHGQQSAKAQALTAARAEGFEVVQRDGRACHLCSECVSLSPVARRVAGGEP